MSSSYTPAKHRLAPSRSSPVLIISLSTAPRALPNFDHDHRIATEHLSPQFPFPLPLSCFHRRSKIVESITISLLGIKYYPHLSPPPSRPCPPPLSDRPSPTRFSSSTDVYQLFFIETRTFYTPCCKVCGTGFTYPVASVKNFQSYVRPRPGWEGPGA
jgi:hypothetical protein